MKEVTNIRPVPQVPTDTALRFRELQLKDAELLTQFQAHELQAQRIALQRQPIQAALQELFSQLAKAGGKDFPHLDPATLKYSAKPPAAPAPTPATPTRHRDKA